MCSVAVTPADGRMSLPLLNIFNGVKCDETLCLVPRPLSVFARPSGSGCAGQGKLDERALEKLSIDRQCERERDSPGSDAPLTISLRLFVTVPPGEIQLVRADDRRRLQKRLVIQTLQAAL